MTRFERHGTGNVTVRDGKGGGGLVLSSIR